MASRQIFASPKNTNRFQNIPGSPSPPRVKRTSVLKSESIGPGPIIHGKSDIVPDVNAPMPISTLGPGPLPLKIEDLVSGANAISSNHSRPKTATPTVNELLRFPVGTIITDLEQLIRKNSMNTQYLSGAVAQLKAVLRTRKVLSSTDLQNIILDLPVDEQTEFLAQLFEKIGIQGESSHDFSILDTPDGPKCTDLSPKVSSGVAKSKNSASFASKMVKTEARNPADSDVFNSMDSTDSWGRLMEANVERGLCDVGDRSLTNRGENESLRGNHVDLLLGVHHQLNTHAGNLSTHREAHPYGGILSRSGRDEGSCKVASVIPGVTTLTKREDTTHQFVSPTNGSFSYNNPSPAISNYEDYTASTEDVDKDDIFVQSREMFSSSSCDNVIQEGFCNSTPKSQGLSGTENDGSDSWRFPFADVTFEVSREVSADSWENFDPEAYRIEQERLFLEHGEQESEDWDADILADAISRREKSALVLPPTSNDAEKNEPNIPVDETSQDDSGIESSYADPSISTANAPPSRSYVIRFNNEDGSTSEMTIQHRESSNGGWDRLEQMLREPAAAAGINCRLS